MKTVNFVSKVTFAAGLCLALASTFSCSSDSSSGGGEENISSSSIASEVSSSSSAVNLSSSSEAKAEISSSSIIDETSSSSGTVDLSSSSENTTELSSSSIVNEVSSSSSENVTEPSSSSVVNDISSSSSSENKTDNLSDLPKQVYLKNGITEFTGDGDVVLILHKLTDDYKELLYSDTVPAGKIQNGKLTLNLPENIDGKYLGNSNNFCDYYENCNISITGNILIYGDKWDYTEIIVNGSNKEHLCWLYLDGGSSSVGGVFIERAPVLKYFSDSGNASGTAVKTGESCSSDGGIGDDGDYYEHSECETQYSDLFVEVLPK